VLGVAAERARLYMFNIFGPYNSFFESSLLPAWRYCVVELERLKASVNPKMKMVVGRWLAGWRCWLAVVLGRGVWGWVGMGGVGWGGGLPRSGAV
jgi:hypothetical protein